jgi:hypothetical protein
MLFSHRFSSVETLSRAQYWLAHHGFEVVKADQPSHDPSRLTLHLDFSQASAALALIDSIELSDPEGWSAHATRLANELSSQSGECSQGHRDLKSCTPICWHPREEAIEADPVSSKMAEYMFSRWE